MDDEDFHKIITFYNSHYSSELLQQSIISIMFKHMSFIWRIMLEIRGNISFFILRSIWFLVTSSQCGDEALLAKMYPTNSCQYTRLAVKRLVKKNESPYISIKLDSYSLPTWKSIWHSSEYVKQYQLCNTFQFTSEPLDVTRPWPTVYVPHYSTLMVILPMPCWGCRVKPHGMAVPSDAFTHIIPFSIHIFYLVLNIEKHHLKKTLGNFSFVSIYYHWNWFEDLHHVQGIEIKDDSEMLHSQYLRENNGTTCHHGHPADCQLALTNVVEVQAKVVTND